MKAQVIVVALIVASITALTFVIALHTHSGALAPLLWWLSFGAFLPFGIGAACGLTNSKHVVVIVTIFMVLVVAPDGVLPLSRALVPIGMGVLLGSWARSARHEESHEPPSA
jgi:hypothetical protein